MAYATIAGLPVAAGESLRREEFLEGLVAAGYRRVDLVELAGDFAVRGAIIDVICPALGRPLRLEMDGDTVVSLRHFEADTQRSLERVARAVIGPSSEVLLTREERLAMLSRLPEPASGRGARRVGRLRCAGPAVAAGGCERFCRWR